MNFFFLIQQNKLKNGVCFKNIKLPLQEKKISFNKILKQRKNCKIRKIKKCKRKKRNFALCINQIDGKFQFACLFSEIKSFLHGNQKFIN